MRPHTLALTLLVFGCSQAADEAPPATPDVPVATPDVPAAAPDVPPAVDVPPPVTDVGGVDTADAGPQPPPPDPGALDGMPPLSEVLCLAGVPHGGQRQELAVERLLEAGVSAVRTGMYWHTFEPKPGELHPEKIEAWVGPYLDAGIEVIGLLAYGNPWASSLTETDHMYPPDDPADFANFVSAMATLYEGRIERWEIWNEPNAGFRFWKTHPNGDAPAYGALLKAAVVAGRAACPGCAFSFGGTFFHTQFIDGHLPFLTLAQDTHPDLADHYDAMAFHPYAPYPPAHPPEGKAPDHEWSHQEMVSQVRALMGEQGAADRPFWTTEVGWPIFGEIDLATQAAYLVRSVMHLTAAGAHPVCWYNLFDGKNPEVFPPEQAFGLLTHGDLEGGELPEPKPAFLALTQLGNRFAQHRLVRDLRASGVATAPVYGYELDGPDRWWVLWAYPAPEAVPFPLPEGAVEARDMVGAALTVPTSSVSLDASPVFIRFADAAPGDAP